MPEISYTIGATLTAIGLLFAIAAVVSWRRGLSSLAWPQTTGVVLTSSLTEAFAMLEVSVPETHNLIYEYEVGGIKYSSNTIAYTHIRKASENKEKYRVGLNVSVYYNPEKPKMSVLEPGVGNANTWTIFGSIILFSIGIALIVLGVMWD